MSEDTITVAEQFDDLEQEQDASRLGMWVFLGTEILFFSALFTGYLILRMHFNEAFAMGSRDTNLTIGIIESSSLLLSSLTASLAVHQLQAGASSRSAVLFLLLTIFFGVVMVALEGLGYHHDYVMHHVPGLNFEYQSPYARQVELFYFMYYVMTGYHLLHLLLGIVILSVIARMTWRGTFNHQYYSPVEVSVLFWQFVNILWIFMFPLFYLVSRT